MFLSKFHNRRRGFTLIELAIVLGVVAVLGASLWRLISTSNQQTKDQNTAQQQQQLITAVKGFLASADGQTWMSAISPYTASQLYLPTISGWNVTTCTANVNALSAGAGSFCNFLPQGFYSGTTNPYGQSYYISVLKDSALAGTAPQTYSFMIVTYGATIPDADGGRISGMIGGDGGFIYSSAVCTAAASTVTACGALGAWSVANITINGGTAATAGYGIPAADEGAGSIASRSFISPTADNSQLWLARTPLPTSAEPTYNEMNTNIYMGGGTFTALATTSPPPGNNIFFQTATNPLTGNPTSPATLSSFATAPSNPFGTAYSASSAGIYMGDGTGIYGLGSSAVILSGIGIGGPTTIAKNPNLTIYGDENFYPMPPIGTIPTYTNPITGAVTNQYPTNPLLIVNGDTQGSEGCAVNTTPGTAHDSSTCQYTMQINGDILVNGVIYASNFYAGKFGYLASSTTSDRRLKKDIKTLSDPLADIMKIDPVSFTYKRNNQKSMGVIAQDLEKIYPELVGDTPEGYKGVNYEGLIAPLIGAIQELKKENDDLRAQLQNDTAHQEKIEQELEKLKQQ